MTSKRINITMPLDLLSELDGYVLEDVSTRSNYIREAIELKKQMDKLIKNWPVDPKFLEQLVFTCRVQRADRKYMRAMRKLSWKDLQD